MMQKMVYCEDEEFEKPSWIIDMGTFNTMPQPWCETDADEYWHLTGAYSPSFVEFRQVHESNEVWFLTISYYHGFAMGVSRPMDWTFVGDKIHYNDLPRYFKIGCVHEYEGLDPVKCRELGIFHGGRCYHVSKCKKCGHVHSVDSSD